MIKLKILSLSFLERDVSPRILQQTQHHHWGGFSLIPGDFPACPADLHRANNIPQGLQVLPTHLQTLQTPILSLGRTSRDVLSSCLQPASLSQPIPKEFGSSPTPRVLFFGFFFVFFSQGNLCLCFLQPQSVGSGGGITALELPNHKQDRKFTRIVKSEA